MKSSTLCRRTGDAAATRMAPAIPNRNDLEMDPASACAARCLAGDATMGPFTLLGCTVAPGFEYTDYNQNRQALIERYPRCSEDYGITR